MVVNKAFLTVVDNKGVNGFPYGMAEFGKYYYTGVEKRIKDRIKLGEVFTFHEGDNLAKIKENKFRFYADAPITYESVTLGAGNEGSFKAFVQVGNNLYASTGDGVAVAKISNMKRWTWYKNGLYPSKNVIKVEYDELRKIFFVATDYNIYISTDNCQSFTPIGFNGTANGKYKIKAFRVRTKPPVLPTLPEKMTELVVGTDGGGMFYTRIPVSTPVTSISSTLVWNACPKMKMTTRSISSYPGSAGRVDPMSSVRVPETNRPLSNIINDFEWHKDAGTWIVACNNGVFRTADFLTYAAITDEVRPDFSGYAIQQGDGQTPPTLPMITIDTDNKLVATRIISANNEYFFIIKTGSSGSTIGSSNGVYRLTTVDVATKLNVYIYTMQNVPGTSDTVPVATSVTNIKEFVYGFNVYAFVLDDNTMLYSFDNLKTYFKREPSNGYASRTIQCAYKAPDRFIFGAQNGIIFSIEDKIRLSFLNVNRDPETKATTPGLPADSNLFEFTVAIHADTGFNNSVVTRSMTLQGRKATYTFVVMVGPRPDGSEYCRWYLFGHEPRYSEMKVVAAEFGIT